MRKALFSIKPCEGVLLLSPSPPAIPTSQLRLVE